MDPVDPQTWLFPPAGVGGTPSQVSANFGPVYKGDSIVLTWAPASEKPGVYYYCTNDIPQSHIVSTGTSGSPFTYTFTQDLVGGDSQDHVCHFWFAKSKNGNSATFRQFQDNATNPATKWQADTNVQSALGGGGGSAAATVVQTETVSGAGSTGTATLLIETVIQQPTTVVATVSGKETTLVSTADVATSTPSIALSNNGNSDASSSGGSGGNGGGGLSAGAAAGITIAAVAVVALVAALLVFLVLRRRRRQKEGSSAAAAAAGGRANARNETGYEHGTEVEGPGSPQHAAAVGEKDFQRSASLKSP